MLGLNLSCRPPGASLWPWCRGHVTAIIWSEMPGHYKQPGVMLLFLSAPCVSLICECVLRGAGLRDQAVMLRAALPGGAFSVSPSVPQSVVWLHFLCRSQPSVLACCICAGGGVISITFISIDRGRFKANNEVRSRITAKQGERGLNFTVWKLFSMHHWMDVMWIGLIGNEVWP